MRSLNILIFCLISNFTIAQNNLLTGKVVDRNTNANLIDGVVTLINIKDSSLIAFTRIKNDGSFGLPKPNTGTYLLLISHPRFADLLDTINVLTDKNNLGNFNLLSKIHILEQVIVRAKIAPIKINGDTTIYTADSFKVKDGANVEDLLKKLPGIQVGKNGEIKAMDETVKKVLVDGEEFFGSDPGIVVKNLQANAVDKVELFDKKSDQATFTGIDDGVKDKTINLKLKNNKKNGYFGKIEGSGGLPDNYDTQAMLNAFKAKRKLAFYGLMGNIGNTQLGWDDNNKFSDDDGIERGVSEDGGTWASIVSDDLTNFYGGTSGIPKNWNLGAHYSNKLNNDKQTINFSYKYNKINSIADSRVYSKTFLPDTSWNDNSASNTYSSKNRNKITGSIETKIDSNNVVKLNFATYEQNNNTISNNNNQSFTPNIPINEGNRQTTSTATNKNLTGTALWMHKFKKKSRTLSISTSKTYNETKSDGFLLSQNAYYKNGNLIYKDTLDQEKIATNTANNFTSKISYTEPITKKLTMELGYSITINNSDNNKKSLNKTILGKYDSLVAQYSNHYEFKNNIQSPNIKFKYSLKKITASMGTKLSYNKYEQNNITTNLNRKYDFTNIFPSAGINIKMKKNAGFNLNYNGNSQAPSLNQLQPIQDNSNPLFVVIGNPDLKQSFSNSFSGNYNKFDVINSRGFYSYFNFNTYSNSFSNYNYIDTFGKTISKTVNVNGNKNAAFEFNYNFKIKKFDMGIGVGPNFNISKTNDFVNGFKNTTKSNSYGVSIDLDKWVNDKNEETVWGIYTNNRFKWNQTKATINTASEIKYWSINGNVDINVMLPLKIELENELQYNVQQKNKQYPQNANYTLWNVSAKKDIVKKIFTIEFSVKDLLNQNRGYNRNFSSYNYTESYYNTLKRYWYLTFTYKFNSQKINTKSNVK